MATSQNRKSSLALRGKATIALSSALAGAGLLTLSMNGTLSAFTASIVNDTNTTEAGALALTEASGALTCNSYDGDGNTYTCSSINKYGGGYITADQPAVTTVTMSNSGTIVPSAFTLAAGTCVQSGTSLKGATVTDFCDQVNVAVYKGDQTTGTLVYNGLASAMGSTDLTPLPVGGSQDYTFVVSLKTTSNDYMGLKISQPLTWTVNA